MKRKLLIALLTLVCAVCCAIGFTACDSGSGNGKEVTGLKIENGSVTVKYGETPDVSQYKLYVYRGEDKEEISRTDSKLSVKYYEYDSKTGSTKEISKFPDKWLAGTYSAEYVYDGKTEPHYKAIFTVSVERADSGNFTVQPQKTVWDSCAAAPEVTLKNPNGAPVKTERVDGSPKQAEKTDDTDGLYELYYFNKTDYDALTAEQKADSEYISSNESRILYTAGSEMPAGEYMLVGVVNETYNYNNVVTPAVQITVKDPFAERVFTLQSVTVQDADGKAVTDEDNEFVGMAESLQTGNQNKTVICKPPVGEGLGLVRGTVDLGAGPFDELTGEDVMTYSPDGAKITIYADGTKLGEGVKTGNTLTLKMQADSGYFFIITFTCD